MNILIAEAESPSAGEEIARPILEHLRLQGRLQAAGYLAPSESIDGVYGPITRAAIVGLQQAEELKSDGLMSDDVGQILLAPRDALVILQPDLVSIQSVESLEAKYQLYLSDLSTLVEERAEQDAAEALRGERRILAQSLSNEMIAEDLRAFLKSYLAVLQPGNDDSAALIRLIGNSPRGSRASTTPSR